MFGYRIINNCIIILTILLNCCNAFKILVVFPVPGKSHSILGEGYVRHLLAAGHEVTYITPLPVKEPPPGLRQIDVSENFKFLAFDFFDVEKFMTKSLDLQDYFLLANIMHDVLSKTYELEVIQNFISDPKEQFDVVIVEWLYSELTAGFSSVFNCPYIWSSSMIPHTAVLSLIDEHFNVAYSVEHLSRQYSFTLWDRAYHLWYIFKLNYSRWLQRDEYNEYFKRIFGPATIKRGRQLPHFEDVKYNASLMLGNSHVATGDSIALPQNYKHIGGYHIKNTTDPLPKDLQKLMDESKDGVIYFSMGTMLKSSRIPDKIKKGLLDMFGQLKQTVIWKVEKMIPDLPKNVHVVTWAPQQSILAHPNCILFITHGGLLSLMETLTAGIPIIGVPFYADQFLNIERAAVKGFGKRINFDGNTPEDLRIAIKEMIENPSYRERAKESSAIFKNNIVPPSEELVYWVEYVAKTKGASHLRSPALNTSWYKKICLDLILLSVVAIILVLKVCTVLVSSIRIGDGHKKKLS